MFGKFITKRLFSSKVAIGDVKKLRGLTGAPLSACKKALAETNSDFTKAKAILRERDLAYSEKKEGKEATQGVWGFATSADRTKGVLVNLTCQTDFVAKSEPFVNFCKKSLETLINADSDLNIEKETDESRTILDSIAFDTSNSILEAKKIMISQTEENIEFAKILKITAPKDTIIGHYVHKTLAPGVGSAGSFMTLEHNGEATKQVHNLADNLAVHCFGMKPKFVYENEFPKEEYDAELARVGEEMKDVVEGKPQKVKEMILKGKLNKFLEGQDIMEYQNVGFMESDDNIQTFVKGFEKENKVGVKIMGFENF